MEREVTAAAGNKCTHLIPVTEIPLSPVFGPHDLIPVPFDDASDKVKGNQFFCSFQGSHSQVPCDMGLGNGGCRTLL